jgi:hypothetical protein
MIYPNFHPIYPELTSHQTRARALTPSMAKDVEIGDPKVTSPADDWTSVLLLSGRRCWWFDHGILEIHQFGSSGRKHIIIYHTIFWYKYRRLLQHCYNFSMMWPWKAHFCGVNKQVMLLRTPHHLVDILEPFPCVPWTKKVDYKNTCGDLPIS